MLAVTSSLESSFGDAVLQQPAQRLELLVMHAAFCSS